VVQPPCDLWALGMSPAAARALELFRDAEAPSEFQKLAFNYYQAAGWTPEQGSFDAVPGGYGDGGDAGGYGGAGFPGGGQGGQGDQTASGEPGGATGEESWWKSMLPKGTQGWADAARTLAPGGMAGMLATSPLMSAGLGAAGGAVSAMRGKGFGSGFKSMSGLSDAKGVWDIAKAPIQAAKAIAGGAGPVAAATGAGRILPGVGAAIGIGQSAYGAVTGDQNYSSDGFWGQMGEQGLRTVGNLMSGAKLGPKGLMAVGGAEAANVLSNAGRAVGDVWDAARSGGFGNKGAVTPDEVNAFKQRRAERKAQKAPAAAQPKAPAAPAADASGSTAQTAGAASKT